MMLKISSAFNFCEIFTEVERRKKMTRFAVITAIFILTLTTSGCRKKYTALDYFPFAENQYCEYDGDGHALANMQTFTGYVNGQRMQRRNSVNDEFPAQTEIFEYKNQTITCIRADVSTYYIEDTTYLGAAMDLPILREPIELGNEWSTRDGGKFTITAVNKRVTVPYGTFNAIEVTSEFPGARIEKNYYAPGVGLIETRYSIDNGPWIISRLSKITKNHSLEIPVPALYVDPSDNGVYMQEVSLTLKTNADVSKEVEKILKSRSPDDAYGPLISKGSMNFITVMRADNTSQSYAIIDFNPEVYEINDSEEAESSWLYAVGCTIGMIYGVEYATIYVDGLPFSGRFIQLSPDDFIIVNDYEEEFY